jgi:hypothetical protein
MISHTRVKSQAKDYILCAIFDKPRLVPSSRDALAAAIYWVFGLLLESPELQGHA